MCGFGEGDRGILREEEMRISFRIGHKYLRPWITISVVLVTMLVFHEYLSSVLFWSSDKYTFWLCTTTFLFIFTTLMGNIEYHREKKEEKTNGN